MISLSLAGCASARRPAAVAQAPLASHILAPAFDSVAEAAASRDVAAASAVPADTRKVGDWVVTEVATRGRKKPLVLNQKVIARDGDATVVEVSLQDGARTETFRVRTEGDEITDVTRVKDGVEHASTPAAYEAMLQRTIPAVDQNDGLIDSEPVDVDFGGSTVKATRTSFHVHVGGKEAVMTLTQRDGFAWGDIAGEVTAKGGKMLYRARVVEAGSDGARKTVAFGD